MKEELPVPARLQVRLMGGLSLLLEGEPREDCLRHTKMGRALLCCLILARGRFVSFDRIYKSIAGKGQSKRVDNSLRVLACRTRSELKKAHPALADCFLSEAGGYRWNMRDAGQVDVFAIEELCEALGHACAMGPGELARLQDLMRLYKPRLLPEFHKQAWVAEYAQELSDRVRWTALHVSGLLWETEDWDTLRTLYDFCERAIPGGLAMPEIPAPPAIHSRPDRAGNPRQVQADFWGMAMDIGRDLLQTDNPYGAPWAQGVPYDTKNLPMLFEMMRCCFVPKQAFQLLTLRLVPLDRGKKMQRVQMGVAQHLERVLSDMLPAGSAFARDTDAQYICLIPARSGKMDPCMAALEAAFHEGGQHADILLEMNCREWAGQSKKAPALDSLYVKQGRTPD